MIIIRFPGGTAQPYTVSASFSRPCPVTGSHAAAIRVAVLTSRAFPTRNTPYYTLHVPKPAASPGASSSAMTGRPVVAAGYVYRFPTVVRTSLCIRLRTGCGPSCRLKAYVVFAVAATPAWCKTTRGLDRLSSFSTPPPPPSLRTFQIPKDRRVTGDGLIVIFLLLFCSTHAFSRIENLVRRPNTYIGLHIDIVFEESFLSIFDGKH